MRDPLRRALNGPDAIVFAWAVPVVICRGRPERMFANRDDGSFPLCGTIY